MKKFIACILCLLALFNPHPFVFADEEAFPLSNLEGIDFDWAVSYSAHGPVDSEVIMAQQRDRILSDFKNRMSKDFKIPGSLRDRVEFWFSIYTQYGEADHVIHHVRYPWIVYKVVNTSDQLLLGQGPKWLRRQRGDKVVDAETSKIRAALSNLTRKSPARFTPLERSLAKKLEEIPGPRARVYSEAARNVRSQLGQKDFFVNGLVNSSRYLPYIEEAFQQMNVPLELTRLPFVESSFNEKAYSRVGASGIWQIMMETGRAYMLVNDKVDERNSPLKASRVAAKLLRSYYRALGNWPLAITSYNHGIGNIQKAIRATNSRDLSEIIARYHRGDFRFASSNFYTCFLAALYAERYHDLIFQNVPRLPLMEREVVRLARETTLSEIQNMTGLNRQELFKYNLDIRPTRINAALPAGYILHLPPGFRERFLKQASQPARKQKISG